MSTPRRLAERYPYERLIAHLDGAGDRERLFELVEKRGFLARQADFLEAFGRTSQDVEVFVLPAAVAEGDWGRFLHYAALALNLRGVAEDLADPEILGFLAASGRVDFALDAAGRLGGLWDQVTALAAVAAECPQRARKAEILGLLCDRLDDPVASPGDEKAAGEALLAIAAHVGSELDLRKLWPGWIRRFAPGQEGEIRLALANRWLQADDALSPGLWQALEALGNPAQVMAIAPRGLAGLRPADPQEVLERLGSLLPGTTRRQEAGAAFLGCLAKHEPARAVAAWEAWTARERPDWAPKIIQAAAGILGRLSSPQIEEIAAAIQDPAALAALRVAVLGSCATEETAAAALKALTVMPDHEDKLHWSLRYLTALPQEPSAEVRRQVVIVGEHLHSIGYAADGEELARYLDLVAVFLLGEMRTRLESVVWSYGLRPETLLRIARATRQPAVALHLLEKAERYAATVSESEQSGFELRKQLLIAAACRYIELTKELKVLPGIVERLLPEEEDELRQELARRPGLEDARATLCESITDDRLRLLTKLRLSSAREQAEELTPSKLYASLAQVRILAEECSGLTALLERPDDPQGLLQQYVLPLRSLRTRALLRLARHTVAFEKEFRDRPDLLLPVELVRWLLIPETREELIELTPEITEISAEPGGTRAVQEVQEAARRLAGLLGQPEQEKDLSKNALAAFEELLFRVGKSLLTGKSAADALASIARLPRDLRHETARQKLCARWSQILPWIAAAADRLPERERKRVRTEMKKGLVALAEERHKDVFRLCLAEPEERVKLSASLGPEADPEVLRARAYLETPARLGCATERFRHLPDSDVWLGPASPGDSAWIERVALWLSQEGWQPSRLEIEPILEWLRQEPEVSCRALASEMVGALRRGRRSHGEAFLRTWLHAWLPVRWGHRHPEGVRRSVVATASLLHALTLDPGATAVPGSSSVTQTVP